MATTTYTISVGSGSCIGTDQVTITITPVTTPTFNAIGPLCQNTAAPSLPTTSTNGISGSWSGSISTASTGTTAYNFVPNVGQCANNTSMNITVNALPTPNAGTDQSGCSGSAFTIGNDPVYTQEGATFSWSSGASGTLDLSGGGQNHGTTSVSPGASTTYTLTVTALNGCSNTDQVNITIDPCGLPVELFELKADCDDYPLISWITASESNNDYFTLYHSCDGINFVEIAQQSGAGTSTETTTYSHADIAERSCPSAIHYYKLEQTDFDGKKEIQGIVSTKCDNKTIGINVYRNALSISSDSYFDLTVISSEGKIVYQTAHNPGKSIIDTSSWSNGIYFIMLNGEKILIEKIALTN